VTQSFAVRDVRREDFAGWKLLWDGYNAFYGRSGEAALAEEITQTTWTRFFDATEPVQALVAEQDGKLLGLAHFLFHRTTIQLNRTCYLNDLFTLDAARGRGVGRALILAVYEKARAAGSTRIYWQTHETNSLAMKLYDAVADKSGFLIYRKSL
jgi:GNAT superfamily N-acetyltransferase